MTAIVPNASELIDAYWSAERCGWSVRLYGKFWTVVLEWTQEYGNPHGADWVTYTWEFYDEAFDVALSQALDWCEALAVWAPCPECDGRGIWQGIGCADCNGTGLENGSTSEAES